MEQECSVWVTEEASEIAFAVFVAYISNEIKIGIVAFRSNLLKCVLDQFITFIVSVREEEQNQNVNKSLLDGGTQRGEESVDDDVLQAGADALVHCLLPHLDRQFVLWEIPRKCIFIVLILQSERCSCEVEFPLVIILLVQLYVHR